MSEKIAEGYVEVNARLAPLEKSLDRLKGKLQSLTSTQFSLPTGGLLQTLGLGAGLYAAGRAVKTMVGNSADLAEAINKSEVAFGKSADVITSKADEMAKKFGTSKRVYIDTASSLGLMAQGAKLGEAESAAFSVSMAKLAMDASSLYNVPLPEALAKIKSGLAGEALPLRDFGVNMEEAAVTAQALAMGFKPLNGEFAQNAKFMARAALIVDGLAKSTGDLERTQGSAKNQAREFMGRLENLADAIGASLIPAATTFLQLLNEIAVNMTTTAEKGGGAWTAFTAGVKSAVETAGVIYRNWGSIVERTGVMIGGWITNMVERFTWLKDTIAAFLGWFGTNWRSIFADAFNAITTALGNLGKNFQEFGKSAYDWISSGFSKPFEMKLTPVMEGFQAKTTAFEAPKLKLSSVQDQLDEIDQRMVDSEQKRADNMAEKAGEAKPAPGQRQLNPEPGASKKELKSEFVGLAEFAKKIQSGSLEKNRDKAAKDTAQNTAQALGYLEKIANKPLSSGPGFAVGPA